MQRARARELGLSLIEMMVTLLIGAFLMIGVMAIFAQSRTHLPDQRHDRAHAGKRALRARRRAARHPPRAELGHAQRGVKVIVAGRRRGHLPETVPT